MAPTPQMVTRRIYGHQPLINHQIQGTSDMGNDPQIIRKLVNYDVI